MLLLAFSAGARTQREIFSKAFNVINDPSAIFKPGGDWFPYPAYSDRAAWDSLTGRYKAQLIENGEKWLDFQWIVLPASAYLEYESTKSRTMMNKFEMPNRQALAELTLAELAEGKGRFILQIINGVFYASERTSWNYAQHTSHQKSQRTLPVKDEPVITLLGASYAMNVAIAWHFFHEEWDKYDPSISKTVLAALEHNTFKPYMEHDWWWMGFSDEEGGYVNNWNCHCNFFVTLAFLLADQNPERLVKAVERSLRSFDKYMDYAKLDGACEEGPSYWTMAGGKVYDYARMMCDASNGRINVLNDSQVRKMGEFMVSSFIGDGWQLVFGDGPSRVGNAALNRDLFLRFGHDTGSAEFENLGLSLLADPVSKTWLDCDVCTYAEGKEQMRALEVLRADKWLAEDKANALKNAGGDWNKMVSGIQNGFSSIWYGSTEVAILRNPTGWYVGAKGGNNGESHGHHDLGSALVFVDQIPVFIDPGVAQYVKETFGPLRYTLWYMQTEWHNTAMPNGFKQGEGPEYHTASVSCDPGKGVFRCDFAPAYPAEAGVRKWERTYSLGKDALKISDSFNLSERKASDDVHFITPGDVFLPGESVDGYKVNAGEIIIRTFSFDGNRSIKMRFNFPKTLTPTVEDRKVTDKKLDAAWTRGLRKITFLSSPRSSVSGTYTFSLSRFN